MHISHPDLQGHLLDMWQAIPKSWFSQNQLVFSQFGQIKQGTYPSLPTYFGY